MSTFDLEDVHVLELSLVDTPANQHAAVVLYKSLCHNSPVKPEMAVGNSKGDGSVTVEDLTKSLEQLQAQVADLTKKAAAAETAKASAEASVEALTKSARDAGMEVIDGVVVKRAAPEYVEIAGEKVEKSLVPGPVLKALEKQAADIAKMQADAEAVALSKRGEAELPNLAGTALAKGRLLAAVEGDAEMTAALKAADAAMAGVYTEKGHAADHDASAPATKLEKMARDYATTKGVTYETAYAEVTKTDVGRALQLEMRAGN